MNVIAEQQETLLDFLKKVPPFDLLPEKEQKEVVKKLDRRCYAPNTLVHTQGYSPVRHLSLVFSGKVEKYFLNKNKQKEFIEFVSPGETYGGISLLLNGKRSIRTVIAVEETVIYNLPSQDFINLCQQHETFSNYYTDRFGRRMLNAEYAAFVMEKKEGKVSYEHSDHFFKQKIREIYTTKVTVCGPDTPIREVAALMTENRTGSVLVEVNGRFEGIVTDIDLRNKVVAKGHPVEGPVAAIMTSPVLAIQAEAYIYEAILSMFKRKVNQLVVMEGTECVGMVSRNKLLHSRAKSPFIFIQGIHSADRLEELVRKWQQVPEIVNQLLNRGVRAEIVNEIISTISDAITQNILQQTISEIGEPPARFVYMTLGSDGRREQTLKTDQDNAIIYEDVKTEQRPAVREYFLKLGELVSFKLDQVGFEYCKGELMAKNPKWTHSLSHWKENYRSWIKNPEPEAALRGIIFFDCRAIYGEVHLINELKAYISELLEEPSNAFFFQLAKNSLEVKPPIGFFKNFHLVSLNEKKNVLDIKRSMSIIVDFARVYALKYNILETNTGQRLLRLWEKDVLSVVEYHELMQAYYYMMQLRLLKQTQALMAGEEPDNLIDPKTLTKIERVTLREIFKVIEKYQTKLSITFTGSFLK